MIQDNEEVIEDSAYKTSNPDHISTIADLKG